MSVPQDEVTNQRCATTYSEGEYGGKRGSWLLNKFVLFEFLLSEEMHNLMNFLVHNKIRSS